MQGNDTVELHVYSLSMTSRSDLLNLQGKRRSCFSSSLGAVNATWHLKSPAVLLLHQASSISDKDSSVRTFSGNLEDEA